jgi:hypothetical protein
MHIGGSDSEGLTDNCQFAFMELIVLMCLQFAGKKTMQLQVHFHFTKTTLHLPLKRHYFTIIVSRTFSKFKLEIERLK